MNNTNHIVIGANASGTTVIRCLRCNDIYKPAMPVSVHKLCKISDLMVALHAECKQKEDDE